MLNQTRRFLQRFYAPFNHYLAEYLGDKAFNYTTSYDLDAPVALANLTRPAGKARNVSLIISNNSSSHVGQRSSPLRDRGRHRRFP